MSLWQGRFDQKPDSQMWALNASIGFDIRLAEQDVRGSQAWAAALRRAAVLSDDEHNRISEGLDAILAEFQTGNFVLKPDDEDVHTAVERRLGEIIGPLAGKLHTGRSRNDQVATDFRLWLLDQIPVLIAALADLQTALIWRAEADFLVTSSSNPTSKMNKKDEPLAVAGDEKHVIMPGYTHLQRAQPILLSHWWLSHFWPLDRDSERLRALMSRVAVLPLGCGALAGVPFDIDRAELAESLGFDSPAPNSLDAVSERDFAVEFLFITALIGTHLSKLAENIVLFTSSEFGFFELGDAYSTGSSLMPQKKNPDPFELARGKAGTLLGYLTGLLGTLKGLPSTYDKDLQEDKLPVFSAFDTLLAILPVIANALRDLTIYPEKMEAAIDSTMMATDLADYLVGLGIPFREAHALTGQAVRTAFEKQKSLDTLSISEYKAIHPDIDKQVFQVFDPRVSISRRKAFGGTAPDAVINQIRLVKARMQNSEI